MHCIFGYKPECNMHSQILFIFVFLLNLRGGSFPMTNGHVKFLTSIKRNCCNISKKWGQTHCPFSYIPIYSNNVYKRIPFYSSFLSEFLPTIQGHSTQLSSTSCPSMIRLFAAHSSPLLLLPHTTLKYVLYIGKSFILKNDSFYYFY